MSIFEIGRTNTFNTVAKRTRFVLRPVPKKGCDQTHHLMLAQIEVVGKWGGQ